MTLPCDGIGPEIKAATLVVVDAVNIVLKEPAKRTRDLGGNINTDSFATLVAVALGSQ